MFTASIVFAVLAAISFGIQFAIIYAGRWQMIPVWTIIGGISALLSVGFAAWGGWAVAYYASATVLLAPGLWVAWRLYALGIRDPFVGTWPWVAFCGASGLMTIGGLSWWTWLIAGWL